MYRIPLWPITTIDSHPLGIWKATGIPVMDIHELAAGKLVALLSRHKARDLFDSHRILHIDSLDFKRLRTAFVVYGTMNRKDWRTISLDDVAFDSAELVSQLAPMLRHNTILRIAEARNYGKTLIKECRQALQAVLPFSSAEQEFLDLLLDKGKINPMILTNDVNLQNRIQQQPLLEWKALNVRQHKRLT